MGLTKLLFQNPLISSTKLHARHFGVRHKVVDLYDAVAIVKNYDTISVSGFVAQSCPEALLRALGERFEETGEPKKLRLLFGGGPGDFDTKGLNHLGKSGMLRSAIGGHFGQVPKIANLVLKNEIAGYAIPMGAISRMLRSQAAHTPGYISRVGLETMVDPRQAGGALNELATHKELVSLLELDGHKYLRYPSIPIDVAFIRGTTGDYEGNITFEHESILADAKLTAMAARSSGGITIAQVERIAAHGSLPSRKVHIPGLYVDCVVVAEKKEHGASYFTPRNAVWTGEIREPIEDLPVMPLNIRKVIARRAAMELQHDDVVNLGIGMPEGVASVASEEGIFQYVTLTTEAGVIGGVGAGGHDFGPGSNPEAFNEMNQQFDLYNGGGLNVCFLGLAQCSKEGNVNVSRLSEDSLTGPGGFIDISQCTHRVVYMGTFTKKGLKVEIEHENGKPRLKILKEGEIKTFLKDVREITFSAKRAHSSGQKVLYITERCVFELNYRGLKILEIAPGIDLEKDILQHMEIRPYIKDPSQIKEMDYRLFKESPMNLYDDLFSIEKNFDSRLEYHKKSHTLYIDLRNQVVTKQEEIDQVQEKVKELLQQLIENHPNKQKVHVVVNYDGFDCKSKLTEQWGAMASYLQKNYYESVRRYSGRIFKRKKLADTLQLESDDQYWNKFTNGGRVLSRSRLAQSLKEHTHTHPTDEIIEYLMDHNEVLKRREFHGLVDRLNYYLINGHIPNNNGNGSSAGAE